MPDEDAQVDRDARRADALVALASASLGRDPDADRATVVIHAPVGTLAGDGGGCEIDGGGVIHPEVARRLACTARIQAVVEDESGSVVHLRRMRRDPPAWMMRHLRYRDHGCTFPGCGSRMFTHAHHIVWWEHGGPTELENLALVCSFHHKVVHEYGWSLVRRSDGEVRWYRPDGRRYRAGPGPPPEVIRVDAIPVPA